jgi:hypothetical protein
MTKNWNIEQHIAGMDVFAPLKPLQKPAKRITLPKNTKKIKSMKTAS